LKEKQKNRVSMLFLCLILTFEISLKFNNAVVHATMPSGPLVETDPPLREFHLASDEGNYVRLEIYGWQLDPRQNNDPTHDYYIFHIWVTVDAVSDWSPTSGGLDDFTGPTVEVNASLTGQGSFLTQYVEPKGYVSEGSAGTINLGLSISLGPVSAGISWSQQIPKWECQTVKITNEAVEWEAADNSGGWNYDRAYSWGFAAGAMLPKGEDVDIEVVAIGSFFKPGTSPRESDRYGIDYPTLFSGHAAITVDPNGGRIYVDGQPCISPQTFLWVYWSTHELSPDSDFYPSPNARLLFVSWHDGNTEDPRTVTVDHDESYTIEWKRQFFLEVETTPSYIPRPTLSPQGPWFDEKTYVNCAARDSDNYTFINWIVDDTERERGQQSIFIYMDSSHSAIVIYDQIPIANLSVGKNTVDLNETVYFDAAGSTDDGRITYYFFDFGDGSNSSWTSSPLSTHKYASNGTYYATVIVMDDYGVNSTNAQLIQVQITVIPEFPTISMIMLFMIATLLAVIVYRRKNPAT
jgi:hypothetical protein